MPANAVTFAELLDGKAARTSAGIRVSQPALVKAFNAKDGTCDVLPLLPDDYVDRTNQRQLLPLGLISNVPIAYPQGGGFRLTWPLTPEVDQVELLFNDRSLERWKSTGQMVDPIDVRRHHQNDAVAVAGLSKPGSLQVDPKNVVLTLSNGAQLLLGGASAADSVGVAELIQARFNAVAQIFAGTSFAPVTADGIALKAAFTALLLLPAWTGPIGSSLVKLVP